MSDTDEFSNLLVFAAANGVMISLQCALDCGADVEWVNEDGVTSLMLASANGHVEIVSALIAAGANVNRQGPRGVSALLLALAWQREAAVARLLEAGADPNMLDSSRLAPLAYAVKEDFLAGIQLLLSHGASANAPAGKMSVLTYAICHRRTEQVRLLIQHGADVLPGPGEPLFPMAAASMIDDVELAALLLGKGAMLDRRVLALADQGGSKRVGDLLVRHRAQLLGLGSSDKWRTIRVFISSTFRDMHAERDHLVRATFPKIREELRSLPVHIVDVDLRWGITKEQAENDGAIGPCLDLASSCEIFVCILGERYGWVPRKVDPSIADRLRQGSVCSITELEIFKGALDHVDTGAHAFFYFRDPAVLDEMPAEVANAVYRDTDPELVRRLADLKDRIRGSGYPVLDPYAAHWRADGLTGLEAFGHAVAEDVCSVVRGQLTRGPAEREPDDPLALEGSCHERVLREHMVRCCRRPEQENALLDEVLSHQVLVVTGPSGSGKSTLLARLCTLLEHRENVTVLAHFVGASPASATLAGTLDRLCAVVKRVCGLVITRRAQESRTEDRTQPVPDADVLKETFRILLAAVPADEHMVVVMDGIDHLSASDCPEELAWVPDVLPANVHFVLSSGTDSEIAKRITKRAQEKGARLWPVPPLSLADRCNILQWIPSLSAKSFDPAQIRLLLDNPATANPGFLVAALEELRSFGSFEKLNERIARLPGGSEDGPCEGEPLLRLFHQVLDRLATDLPEILVRDLACCLACSRDGLTEEELRAVVASGESREPLFVALRQLRTHLVRRGPRHVIGEKSLLRAIEARYLGDEALRKRYHRRLADHFRDATTLERRVFELPGHLQALGALDELARQYRDPDFLAMAYGTDLVNTREHLARIAREAKIDLAEIFRPYIDQPLAHERASWCAADLLDENGRPREAFAIGRQLADHYRRTGNLAEYATTLENQAAILIDRGELDQALDLLEQAERADEKQFGKSYPTVRLNKASILASREDLSGAERMLATVTTEELANPKHRRSFLSIKARLQGSAGRFEEACALLEQLEQLERDVGDTAAVAETLTNRGVFLCAAGQPEKALETLAESSQLFTVLGCLKGTAGVLANRGNVLARMGDSQGALEAWQSAEELFDRLGMREAMARLRANREAVRTHGDPLQASIRLLLRTDIPVLAALVQSTEGEARKQIERTVIAASLGEAVDKAMDAGRLASRWRSRKLVGPRWSTLDDAVLGEIERQARDNDHRRAQRRLEEIIRQTYAAMESAPDDERLHDRYLVANTTLADILWETGHTVESVKTYETSIEIAEALAEAEPGRRERQTDVVHLLGKLGVLLSSAGPGRAMEVIARACSKAEASLAAFANDLLLRDCLAELRALRVDARSERGKRELS